MRNQSFNRPPRVRPTWTSESVELPAPPVAPQPPRSEWASMMLPLAGAGIFAGAAALNGGNPLLVALPSGAMALLGIGAGLLGQRSAARRAASEHAERHAFFEDQLEAQRTRLRRLHEQERAARLYLSPDPWELLQIAGASGEAAPEPRLWERRRADDDFLELRVGSGSIPAAAQARVPPPAPDGGVDRRLFRTAAEYASLRQVPIALPLARLGSLGIAGPRAAALALARALIWQAAVLHAPADLRIAALYQHSAAAEWEWLRWLPHSAPFSNDPSPAARMLAGPPAAATRLSSELLDQLSRRREGAAREDLGPLAAPRALLLVDDPGQLRAHPAVGELLRHGGPLGLAVVLVVRGWQHIPEDCAAMLELDAHGARWASAGGQWPRERFTPDQAELALSDQLARRLAGVRVLESGGAQDVPRAVRLFDLLEIAGPADLERPRWWDEPLTTAWRAQVPIGAGADGQPLCLDLNEGRHGPHGIIAGATGAGKSVLLQSIIAALVATHPPERLQLLLIDFKGGAALMMFAPLPHTAGLVTDLEGRLAQRAMIAIKSELRRRKRLLKDAALAHGAKVEHIGDYRALAASAQLPPLPNLLIVVDEFDELARGNPEFVTELIRVVKQGRSLGVHLLLATQQPARAVTDEIRSQLSYFIALRLGGADDSREMLLKPDAAFLPGDIPGRAYFRAAGEVRLLQVAQVTGTFHARDAALAGPRVSFLRDGREQPVSLEPTPSGRRETDLDILVRCLRSAAAARGAAFPGWSPQRIWQPVLPDRLALSDLFPAGGELVWDDSPGGADRLRQPLGLLDLPQESRREPFAVDLAAGHLAVAGSPGSGKTMLLRALVLGLAWRYSPRHLWCFLVDAGGHGLSQLAGLPHVGAHIQARERERVRRLLRMLDGTIRERQERLRAAEAADLAAYRVRSGEPLPAILVVIDKLAVLREEFRDGRGESEIVDDLTRIARLGRPLGIHLAISADRAAEFGYRLLAMMEQRIALRMTEPHEYAELLGVRVGSAIPAGSPGRALVSHPDYGALEMQVALPVLEGDSATDAHDDERSANLDDDLAIELRERVATLAAAWPATVAAQGGPPAVELLPERVGLASLLGGPAPSTSSLAAPIGRESLALATAWLRLGSETPHALVVGPRRSGKTTALLCAASALAAQHGAEELRLYILDGPRGGLASLRQLPNLALYANDEAGAANMHEALLAARAAGGTRRLILVDDYSLCRERMRAQLTQSYGSPSLFDTLCEIAQLGGQHGEHLLLATGTTFADDNLLRAMDAGRAGLLLWPGRYEGGVRLLGVPLPLADQRGADQPAGRALLVCEDEQQLVQIALP
jgi:S-DNA-T family DNA segregation ATPase FtsK/SpoIIIE